MLYVGRRQVLFELGKGALAIAVFGCSTAASDRPAAGTSPSSAINPRSPTSSPPATSAATSAAPATLRYQRVNLGFVSAYVLERDGEAAVVDTGVAGSAAEIEAGLANLGLAWGDVGHVIITHRHPDHAGSIEAVLEAASGAAGYAGEADLAAIRSPRPLNPLVDGDQVFGLQVVATPGHTAGHISVLDRTSGVLVVGDALNGQSGGVIGPNPQFTDDMTTAIDSVEKLALLPFEVILFGHGEPVTEGGSRLVAELAPALDV